MREVPLTNMLAEGTVFVLFKVADIIFHPSGQIDKATNAFQLVLKHTIITLASHVKDLCSSSTEDPAI